MTQIVAWIFCFFYISRSHALGSQGIIFCWKLREKFIIFGENVTILCQKNDGDPKAEEFESVSQSICLESFVIVWREWGTCIYHTSTKWFLTGVWSSFDENYYICEVLWFWENSKKIDYNFPFQKDLNLEWFGVFSFFPQQPLSIVSSNKFQVFTYNQRP